MLKIIKSSLIIYFYFLELIICYDDNYIFQLNNNVTRENVYFKNRFGLKISADLYKPSSFDSSLKYSSLIIGPPIGGSKEQAPGVYCNEFAKRNFICLAINSPFNLLNDNNSYSFYINSPEIYSETFSSAVDYLGLLIYIDRNKIGAIGISGGGSFALSAAAMDNRIKGIAVFSAFEFNEMKGKEKKLLLENLSKQRWLDIENNKQEYIPLFPENPVKEIPDDLSDINAELYSFYAFERGHHKNGKGGMTKTSYLSIQNYPLLNFIGDISPRPILIVVCENAKSKSFSDSIYEKAKEPKEYFIVPDCNHIDLYDNINKIPFDKTEKFFNESFDI